MESDAATAPNLKSITQLRSSHLWWRSTLLVEADSSYVLRLGLALYHIISEIYSVPITKRT